MFARNGLAIATVSQLVGDEAGCEPVSGLDSAPTGKLTAPIAGQDPLDDSGAKSTRQFNGLRQNSLCDRTGNWIACIRESSRGNSELIDKIDTLPDANFHTHESCLYVYRSIQTGESPLRAI
jgi:hypothetical protein